MSSYLKSKSRNFVGTLGVLSTPSARCHITEGSFYSHWIYLVNRIIFDAYVILYSVHVTLTEWKLRSLYVVRSRFRGTICPRVYKIKMPDCKTYSFLPASVHHLRYFTSLQKCCILSGQAWLAHFTRWIESQSYHFFLYCIGHALFNLCARSQC